MSKHFYQNEKNILCTFLRLFHAITKALNHKASESWVLESYVSSYTEIAWNPQPLSKTALKQILLEKWLKWFLLVYVPPKRIPLRAQMTALVKAPVKLNDKDHCVYLITYEVY